jgi:Zn-dependent protease
MFGKRLEIFKFFGFPVRVDASWLIIALLVTWSLADGLFPAYLPELSQVTYWSMGFIGMLGLFASVLLHEAAHSVVARRFGLKIEGITLFIFGGVAELAEEPRSALSEILIAIAGPIASALLSLLFLLLTGILGGVGAPAPLLGITGYLSSINALLAVFNLLPAFPMDGGRVLRGVIWKWKSDLNLATRICQRSGEILGMGMILFGVLSIVSGSFVGGLWWCLIGLFVRQAAGASYRQLITQQSFQGVSVAEVMTRETVAVPLTASLQEFVEDYVYRYHFDLFPVVSSGRLAGYLQVRDVKNFAREEWKIHEVSVILREITERMVVDPDDDVLAALTKMQKNRAGRLLVARNGRLAGVLVLKDLLDYIALKMELEGR